jgi:hypothetical protein
MREYTKLVVNIVETVPSDEGGPRAKATAASSVPDGVDLGLVIGTHQEQVCPCARG